ncbi:MAG: hypothetical protein KF780_12320 [Sphingomonas sp.]|nr:hypothetical protein [Sphingomonas sp.]
MNMMTAIEMPVEVPADDPAVEAYELWKRTWEGCPGDDLGDAAENAWNKVADAAIANMVAAQANSTAGLIAKLDATMSYESLGKEQFEMVRQVRDALELGAIRSRGWKAGISFLEREDDEREYVALCKIEEAAQLATMIETLCEDLVERVDCKASKHMTEKLKGAGTTARHIMRLIGEGMEEIDDIGCQRHARALATPRRGS